MKRWSLGYEFIRTYVRFAFWLTHKKITVTGTENIPKREPVIFAPNHQNALMDPLAIACTNPLQSVWLARADIFQLKATQPILKYLKILPIYRIRDGKENLSNNEHIFQQVIHILENKHSIALFPEAAHSGKRQMLPHKKAIPRIALEAEEKNQFNLDLQIVPVGIFYDHYWNFNRSLIIEYGKPIGIDKYKEEYAGNPQKAMMNLRDEIYRCLEPLTLNIKSQSHYQEYENIRIIAGNTYSSIKFFSKKTSLQLFKAEKELIGKIWNLEAGSPETFDKIIATCSEYCNSLKLADHSDKEISMAEQANWPNLLIELILIIFSGPIFLFGFVFNALPLFVPRLILARKVKDTAFLSTFNFVIGLILFPLFYILCAAIIFLLSGSWISALIIFILMPFGGKIAFQLFVFYQDFWGKSLFLTGNKKSQTSYNGLMQQRKELVKLIIEKVIE
jgi:1-acyl-sn-glycerol-3-phosphate acyltransferase